MSDLHPWAVGMRVVVRRGHGRRHPHHERGATISRLTKTRAIISDRSYIVRATGEVRPKYLDYVMWAEPANAEDSDDATHTLPGRG